MLHSPPSPSRGRCRGPHKTPGRPDLCYRPMVQPFETFGGDVTSVEPQFCFQGIVALHGNDRIFHAMGQVNAGFGTRQVRRDVPFEKRRPPSVGMPHPKLGNAVRVGLDLSPFIQHCVSAACGFARPIIRLRDRAPAIFALCHAGIQGSAPPKPSGRWPARSKDRPYVSNCVANPGRVWYKQGMQE